MLPGIASVVASAGGITSISLFSSTTSTAATIAWPGGLQAGDVAVLSDVAQGFGVVTSVLPSGFTLIVDCSTGTSFLPRNIESYRILDGSETGNITGMSDVGTGKWLRIFRANRPITSVTPSTWNQEPTTGNPAAQNVAAPPAGSIIIATAYGSDGSTAFSTASPAFDGTQAFGPGGTAIGGYKIYVSSPAGHTIDMNDNNANTLTSGSLTFA